MDLEYLLEILTLGTYLVSVSVVLFLGMGLWFVVCGVWVLGSGGNGLEICVFGLYLCSRLSSLFWASYLKSLAERRQI
jgi:hypothetical protein